MRTIKKGGEKLREIKMMLSEIIEKNPSKTYLLILGIILFLALAIYNFISVSAEIKKNRMKNESKVKQTSGQKKHIKIGDTNKIRMKLVRGGNPLKEFGLNEYNYYYWKIGFAIMGASSVLMKKSDEGDTLSVVNLVFMFIFGFILIDIYTNMKIRKRQKEIKEVLDKFMSITIDGLQMGQVPTEIMGTALKKIPKTNPLWVEIKILNTKLRKGNMKGALTDFRERIDMEEIDNYCSSLMQYEIGGRAVTMMKKQLDLIYTLKDNKKKRETQTKSNLSSVAGALVVVALLIIILIPLLATFKSLPGLE